MEGRQEPLFQPNAKHLVPTTVTGTERDPSGRWFLLMNDPRSGFSCCFPEKSFGDGVGRASLLAGAKEYQEVCWGKVYLGQ